MFKDDEKETKEVWQPFGNTSPLAVMLRQQQASPAGMFVCLHHTRDPSHRTDDQQSPETSALPPELPRQRMYQQSAWPRDPKLWLC